MNIPNKYIKGAAILMLIGLVAAVGTNQIITSSGDLEIVPAGPNLNISADIYIDDADPVIRGGDDDTHYGQIYMYDGNGHMNISNNRAGGNANIYIDPDSAVIYFDGDMLPTVNDSYDLGAPDNAFVNAYIKNSVVIGDLVLSNLMRIIEAEKLTHGELEGLMILNADGKTVMWLKPNGDLKVTGKIEENWEGLPHKYCFDMEGGIKTNKDEYC